MPHAGEISTKSYWPNYRKFWAFWQKPGFLKPFLIKRWHHFVRRVCSWNNCLMLKYFKKTTIFQWFKNYDSQTHVTWLKVRPNMADSISLKTQTVAVTKWSVSTCVYTERKIFKIHIDIIMLIGNEIYQVRPLGWKQCWGRSWSLPQTIIQQLYF